MAYLNYNALYIIVCFTCSIICDENRVKQQTLPAWQPIFSASSVLPAFFVFGIAFIPIGIGVLYFSEIQEEVVDYTYCNSSDPGYNGTCAAIIEDYKNMSCNCDMPFSLDTDLPAQVYMYYGLTNFYQNHRRYVKSRDDNQLLGRLSEEVSSDCSPYMFVTYDNGTKKPIAPCGAISNSFFSDELSLSYKASDIEISVPLIKKGIAWPSDKRNKFRNPPGDLKEALKNYSKPVDWKKHIWELDPEDPTNNGFVNEDFIVWMRTAALPNFRKLYRIIDHSNSLFINGLPKGKYVLHVVYSFPVSSFKGTKSLILSTSSVIGGKNVFLGITYIITGFLLIIMGIVFLVIHTKYGRSRTEMADITPLTPYL